MRQAIPTGFRLSCRRCGALYGNVHRWEMTFTVPVQLTDQTGSWRLLRVEGGLAETLLGGMSPEQWIYCEAGYHQEQAQSLLLRWVEAEMNIRCEGADTWSVKLTKMEIF